MKAKIEPLSILLGFITAILIFLLGASIARTPTCGQFMQDGNMESCEPSSKTSVLDEYYNKVSGCKCSSVARSPETCIFCPWEKSSVFPSPLLPIR